MIADNRNKWHAFTGGEVDDESFGRSDLPDYAMNLARAVNWQILPNGPATTRAGTQFVVNTKDDGVARLIPFIRGNGESLIVEIGAGYFRFHKDGATILDDMMAVYEVENPYSAEEVFELKYEQSVDTITFSHGNWRSRELTRDADNDWDFNVVVHESNVVPPGSAPEIIAVGLEADSITYRYVVTSVDARGEESVASDVGATLNDLAKQGHSNTVIAGLVADAVYYNVYKEWADSGRFFLIGSTVTINVGVTDDNIIPDFTKSPPEATDPFGTADNTTTLPSVVSYFEQRRIFAATLGDPQRFWATKSGSNYNMDLSSVPEDDGPFNYRLSSNRAHTIRHIVPFSNLLFLTGTAVWRIYPDSGGALTPTNIVSGVSAEVGATDTRPVKYGRFLLFANARNEHLTMLEFSTEAAGYDPTDLSLASSHLVEDFTWVQMDFQEAPTPTWWGVRSDGLLIGMTFVPKKNIAAWFQYQLGGDATVESIAIIPETANEKTDTVYLVVNRAVGESTVRFIEFIKPRNFADLTHSFCLDAALTYDDTPVNTVSGLDHLIGFDVTALADGVIYTGTVDEDGAFSLPVVGEGEDAVETTASVITVGLPYNCDLVTPPLAYQAAAEGMEQQEIISNVRLRVKNTVGLKVGPDFSNLRDFTLDLQETAGNFRNGIIETASDFEWSEDSQVYIRQASPYPATITAMAVDFSTGN